MSFSPEVPSSNIDDRFETERLLNETQYWHGTGRYQYDENGEIVDVLEKVVSEGGLIPRHDGFDLTRPMESISLANDRLYGRLYADMHLNDPLKAERDIPQTELYTRYIKGTEIAALKEYYREHGSALELLRMIRSARRTLVKEGRWSKKVHSQEPPIKKVFVEGSDIPDNYPILIGVRSIGEQAQVADYIAKHETRTTEPITLDQMTHLEVPHQVKAEVHQYLKEKNILIPVVAIEDVEKL